MDHYQIEGDRNICIHSGSLEQQHYTARYIGVNYDYRKTDNEIYWMVALSEFSGKAVTILDQNRRVMYTNYKSGLIEKTDKTRDLADIVNILKNKIIDLDRGLKLIEKTFLTGVETACSLRLYTGGSIHYQFIPVMRTGGLIGVIVSGDLCTGRSLKPKTTSMLHTR